MSRNRDSNDGSSSDFTMQMLLLNVQHMVDKVKAKDAEIERLMDERERLSEQLNTLQEAFVKQCHRTDEAKRDVAKQHLHMMGIILWVAVITFGILEGLHFGAEKHVWASALNLPTDVAAGLVVLGAVIAEGSASMILSLAHLFHKPQSRGSTSLRIRDPKAVKNARDQFIVIKSTTNGGVG